MDDFLYNLRKSIKDKRKDRNRRSYENNNYRGLERRTGADRRTKKPAKITAANPSNLFEEIIGKIIKEPLEIIAQSQARIADAQEELVRAEERKIIALDRITDAVSRFADPDGIFQESDYLAEESMCDGACEDDSSDFSNSDEDVEQADAQMLDPVAAEAIHRLRDDGLTFKAIAEHLNETNVPTFSGRGRWHAQAVSKYYRMITASV